MLPVAMSALPPARADGLGAGAGRPRAAHIVTGLVVAMAIAAAAMGPGHAAIAVTIAAVAAAGVATAAFRRIGGYTGDVLGALQQVAEIAVLLAAVASR
jgi:adenosylcobinamide-GDP ribazoletransferase